MAGNNPLVVDGFSGLPVDTSQQHGPRSDSVEWLVDAVERHAQAESQALEQYEYLATASRDPIIALVMRLILEDEERHHGLLKRIESTLRDAVNWTHSPDALPNTAPEQPEASFSDLERLTHELIDEEHTGAKYIRELARKEKGIDGGLHSLLLETMALDSEKHARMLQFVQERLYERSRKQPAT
jgi:hypothetical protein